MKNKILTTMFIFVVVSMTGLSVGCERASDPGKTDPEIKEETENEEVSESTPVNEPEDDQDSYVITNSDNVNEEDTGSSDKIEGKETVDDTSESAMEVLDDEWWPKYDSPEDILDKYMEEQDGASADTYKYLMYDVNADGYEELVITYQDVISEIYGNYKGKYHRAFTAYADYEVTLYPEGMLKVTAPDSSEYTETTWQQYYPEYGDYLPVFEEMGGEYYTVCAYDLDETDKKEIDRSLEDIGEYPVWIGEWADMITKKEYDSLIPKTKPAKLLEADVLSDRSALEVRPETYLYVKAQDGYANLRTGPGTEYEIICQIPDGDNMEVYRKKALSESGTKWQKVTYLTEADNETGYAWLTGWIAESQLE